MSSDNLQSNSSRSRTICHICSIQLSQSPRNERVVCESCRTAPPKMPSQRPGSRPSSTDNSIPSTYLDLLDSKIAEYEHAAEVSDSNGRSASQLNTDNNVDRSAGTKQSNTYSPYNQDAARDNSVKSKRSSHHHKSSSVVMTRFLNDTTEPDGVRDAIFASRLLKSR